MVSEGFCRICVDLLGLETIAFRLGTGGAVVNQVSIQSVDLLTVTLSAIA